MESQDPEGLHQTLRAALVGDRAAWASLMIAWEPTLRGMARAHSALRVKQLLGDDDVAEVVTATFERLRRRDFASLRRYLEQLEQPGDDASPRSLDAWLYGALDFAVRTHLRARYGRAPQSDEAWPRVSRRDLGTNARRLPVEDQLRSAWAASLTAKLTVAEVWSVVEREFAANELAALQLHYLEDKSFSEIADRQGLADAAEAERLIRRLNARLRHRFSKS